MKKKINIIIVLVVAIVLGVTALCIHVVNKPHQPKIYAELTALPVDELKLVDIALMNLLCAEGLPGAKNLNIDECLSVLDQWAKLVKQSEKKYSAQFSQNRQRYDNSYAKFQSVNLGLTLKEDLKCGYNQELVRSGAMADIQSTRFFRNSDDIFLHGFIEKRTGSCSSLPVLMVAIGRRCGYPLYLVTCKGHLFCRWDDGKDRFNIETACPGVDSKPDSYYKSWPHSSTDKEVISEGYLRSLSPKEELGVFAQLRASCLQEHKRFDKALESYLIALNAFPDSVYLKGYINNINRRIVK